MGLYRRKQQGFFLFFFFTQDAQRRLCQSARGTQWVRERHSRQAGIEREEVVSKSVWQVTEKDCERKGSSSRDTMVLLIYLLTILSVLETGQASGAGFRPPAASAPGDIIIGGILPIHETVGNDPDISNLQPCVRWGHWSGCDERCRKKMSAVVLSYGELSVSRKIESYDIIKCTDIHVSLPIWNIWNLFF